MYICRFLACVVGLSVVFSGGQALAGPGHGHSHHYSHHGDEATIIFYGESPRAVHRSLRKHRRARIKRHRYWHRYGIPHYHNYWGTPHHERWETYRRRHRHKHRTHYEGHGSGRKGRHSGRVSEYGLLPRTSARLVLRFD